MGNRGAYIRRLSSLTIAMASRDATHIAASHRYQILIVSGVRQECLTLRYIEFELLPFFAVFIA